jgi:DNA-binding NarL/FixJ family response regulator
MSLARSPGRARGRADAKVAAELSVTMRTVSSYLDRDKTGCRCRADFTRLALRAGLV